MPLSPVPAPYSRFQVAARTTVKVNCGCGFSTNSVEEGESHALTTGHTLTILGEIRSPRS